MPYATWISIRRVTFRIEIRPPLPIPIMPPIAADPERFTFTTARE
jgi:hypothetical protein